jgi:hypothetical protein
VTRELIAVGVCENCGYPVIEEINRPENTDDDVSFQCVNPECRWHILDCRGDQDDAPEWSSDWGAWP